MAELSELKNIKFKINGHEFETPIKFDAEVVDLLWLATAIQKDFPDAPERGVGKVFGWEFAPDEFYMERHREYERRHEDAVLKRADEIKAKRAGGTVGGIDQETWGFWRAVNDG